MKSSGDFCYPLFQATENKGITKSTGVTMRKKCTDQVSIFDLFSNHDIGKELKAMSERLDWHRQIRCCSIKAMDITMHPRPQRLEGTGAQGTPATQCLCAPLCHGHAWPSNKTRWTQTHYNWLESLKFPHDWQQAGLARVHPMYFRLPRMLPLIT